MSQFQSTLPAREATIGIALVSDSVSISIHASREGSDRAYRHQLVLLCISIHASREGSDTVGDTALAAGVKFQSTLPAREATYSKSSYANSASQFQSTLPAREATGKTATQDAAIIISIHASRGGSDPHHTRLLPGKWLYFNPRFPRGKRRYKQDAIRLLRTLFQSTLPAREATIAGIEQLPFDLISIHASREGSDAAPGPQHD